MLPSGLVEGTGIFVPRAPLLFFLLYFVVEPLDFWEIFFFFLILSGKERELQDQRSNFCQGQADAAGPGEGGWMSEEGAFS